MTYITYAPIDRQFGCLERDLPPGAPFNGIDPLDGITFGFALQSRYPLGPGEPDIRSGTVAKKPADNPAILLRVITKAEYDAAYAAEMDARNAPPPPPPPSIIFKADIFRRATEDEADAMTAALNQASARLQGIFAGAQQLSTDDPDFPMIRAGIVAAVGEERADQLLAPST